MTHRRQEKRTWQAKTADKLRRFTAALVGFVPVAIVIIEESRDLLPAELAAAASGTLIVVSRVLANPATRSWLVVFAPWLLSSDPATSEHENREYGAAN